MRTQVENSLIIPDGWRWLGTGEQTQEGDMCCDPRTEPVSINAGSWIMNEESHPVRRRIKSDTQARKKANYVGAPAIFALEEECKKINAAFDDYGCYLVGSALERPDWRDVDVRFIMPDERFAALFPKAGQCWEQDARWLLLTVSISERLSKVTGLPIDFQIQPQTHANERHKGMRSSIGLTIAHE